MRHWFLLLGLGSLLLGAAECWGDESRPHRVRNPEPGMAWTVHVVPAVGKKSPAVSGMDSSYRQPREIRQVNAMGKGIRKQTIFYDSGEELTRYGMENMIVYFNSGNNQIEIEPSSDESMAGPLVAEKLAEFSWVHASNYVGDSEFQSISCAVYRQPWSQYIAQQRVGDEAEISGASSRSGGSPEPQVVAYIDKQTRLPVRLETPRESRDYTFSKTSGNVALPEEFQREWDARLKRIEWQRKRYAIPQ